MTDSQKLEEIDRALTAGNLPEAQRLADMAERDHGSSARLLYLQGKIRMKQAKWGEAISCFLQAERTEPDGPARQCRMMLQDILEFYNKDMYNQ